MRDINLNSIYLQRYIMSHFSSKFRLFEDAAQHKSLNECSEVK